MNQGTDAKEFEQILREYFTDDPEQKVIADTLLAAHHKATHHKATQAQVREVLKTLQFEFDSLGVTATTSPFEVMSRVNKVMIEERSKLEGKDNE